MHFRKAQSFSNLIIREGETLVKEKSKEMFCIFEKIIYNAFNTTMNSR